MHYMRWSTYGDPLAPVRAYIVGRRGAVDGCDRPHHARGLCQAHHARWVKYGDALADVPLRQVATPVEKRRRRGRERRSSSSSSAVASPSIWPGVHAKSKAKVRQLKPDRRPAPSEPPSNKPARARRHRSNQIKRDELTWASPTRVLGAGCRAHICADMCVSARRRSERSVCRSVLCATARTTPRAQTGFGL
jgi:hypothetical protein